MRPIGSTGPADITNPRFSTANTRNGRANKSRPRFGVFSRMPDPDLIELFVLPLERLQVRYLISGSVAAMLYGEPRVTNDIDFAVFLGAHDIARFSEATRRLNFMCRRMM